MFKTQVEPRATGEWFHCQVLDILWLHFMVYLTIRRQARGFYRLIVGEGRSPEPTIKGDRNRERAV